MKIFNTDKLAYHGDRVHKWQNGGNPPPVTVELDMIGACNSNCPRCAGGEHSGIIGDDRVLRLIDELSDIGVRGLTFTGGGEPTLHKGLATAIDRTFTHGIDVGLITNGLIMQEPLMQTAIRCCQWIRVSLDAGSAPDYKESHGGDEEAFRNVCQTIDRLSNEKKKVGSSCTIGVGYLIDDSSISGMFNATTLAKILGADYVQFRPYHLDGWWNGPEDLDIERYRSEYRHCQKEEIDGFSVLESSPKFEKLKTGDISRHYRFCHGQQFCATICATGDVTLCCHTRGRAEFTLGNINEQSFAKIWDGDKRQKVLEKLNMAVDCPPLCRCDGINDILEGLSKNRPHKSFL